MTTSSRVPSTTAPLALLAGGKSGGHVFPALAVAEVLRMRGWRLAFAGNPDSMESRLASAASIPFHSLSSAAFVGRGMLDRIRALLIVGRSVLQARALLGRVRPAVILGTGGFVAVPTVLAGALRRMPIVLLEPNARAGVANRVLSRFAAWAALAYPSAAPDLRCPSQVTGVPVREAFFEQSRRTATVDGAERPRLLVVGGSQGAVSLNRALPGVIRRGLGEIDCTILHQAGAGRTDETLAGYRREFELEASTKSNDTENRCHLQIPNGPSIEVVEFIDDMPAAISAASLVISRAGAVTLGELCAVGRASILLPLPLAGAHQEQNAAELEARGAARVVRGDDWEALSAHLLELLEDPELRNTMAAAASSLARPDAAARIVEKMEELAR